MRALRDDEDVAVAQGTSELPHIVHRVWRAIESARPEVHSSLHRRIIEFYATKRVVRQRWTAAEPAQRWCQHCGKMKKPQWHEGAAPDMEREWLPNKNVPSVEVMEPKPSVASLALCDLGQRLCGHCGMAETPQWRGGRRAARCCAMREVQGRPAGAGVPVAAQPYLLPRAALQHAQPHRPDEEAEMVRGRGCRAGGQ
ncbi:hypothetical protein ZWY2020_006165 [Hordeum vulgare]|nr:hypothetical protein ZWY2020_006165 [Hordeum vulgare]